MYTELLVFLEALEKLWVTTVFSFQPACHLLMRKKILYLFFLISGITTPVY